MLSGAIELESARLAALRDYAILDTAPESRFDRIIELASRICDAPIALFSLVDEHRQWFKGKVGVTASETPREIAFCAHAIQGTALFVVENAREDPRFRDNPLVTGEVGIAFYAGMPVRSAQGLPLGTLCVLDRRPRSPTPLQRHALEVLASQVEAQLELRRKWRELEALAAEVAATRDAVLRGHRHRQQRELTDHVVHDLKGPLTTIMAETEYLIADVPLGVEAIASMEAIAASARAMHRMTLDILDITRSDEGVLRPTPSEFDPGELLQALEREGRHRAERGGVTLAAVNRAGSVVVADRELVRRVLENLIDNALKYGGAEIVVEAERDAAAVVFRVRDTGPGIPLAERERVFDRYAQLDPAHAAHRTSRGLGLAFCRLAVEAMGGRIWVEDAEPRGTTFCVGLPCSA